MAIAPVVIDVLVKGTPQVQQSFKGVQDAAARAERAMQRETERAEKQRQRIRETSATLAGKLAAKQAADEKKVQERSLRETVNAEKAKTRAKERELREQERLIERHGREQARLHAQARREVERIEERSRAKVRADADRAAAQWVRDQARAQRDGAASRVRIATGLVGGAARGVVAGLQRTANVSMGLATVAGQLGGGFSIADSVTGESRLRKQAAVLSANTILSRAGKPGSDQSVGAAMSTDQILGKAKAVGIAQNIDTDEVLHGYDEIKKLTGNVEKATQVMPSIAKLATATGGNLSEMSGLAGNILAADPTMSNDALEKQMRVFTRQGVVGGVEVADFARYGSRITAGASKYGGDKDVNTATLGAMAQMSRQYGGASSAAEAALGSQRFGDDIITHSKDLKAGGIDISDGKGGLRDAQSIILDMLKKTNGDVIKLAGLGLGTRGVKPLAGAASIYKDAGGGQKGLDAVKQEFTKYTTGVTKGEVDDASKRVLEEQKLEVEMRKLRTAVGEELLPEFLKLIPVIRESTPAFVDLLKTGVPAFVDLIKAVSEFANANKETIRTLAEHPVATLIGLEITKSFTAAALPALLQRLMTSAFGGANGGGAGGGGISGKGAVAAAGVAVAAAEMHSLISNNAQGAFEGEDKALDLAAKLRAYGSGDRERGISPEEATRQISMAKGRLDKTNGLEQIGNMLTSPVVDASAKDYRQYKSDQELVKNKNLEQALREVTAALRENSGAVNKRPSMADSDNLRRNVPILDR